MPRLSHCARASGPTHRRATSTGLATPRPKPTRSAGLPRAGTPQPVCPEPARPAADPGSACLYAEATRHAPGSPSTCRHSPRRRAHAAAPVLPLPRRCFRCRRSRAAAPPRPVLPFPCRRSRAAIPLPPRPVPPFPRRHSRTAAALPLRLRRPPISPPTARRAAPRRSANTTASLRPDGAPRTTAPAPVVGPSRSHPCRRPRQPRSGGAFPPRSARSRSPSTTGSPRPRRGTLWRRGGADRAATPEPPPSFRRRSPARASPGPPPSNTTAGRETEPAARVEAVLPSGAGTAVVATSGVRPPGGCSSLIEGSGGPRAGRPTGDRPDTPARCVLPVPRSRGPWSTPAPTRHADHADRAGWRRWPRPSGTSDAAAARRRGRARAPGPVHATVRSPGAGVAACGRARPPPSSRRGRKSSATTGPNGSCAPRRSRPDPPCSRRPRSLAPGHPVVGASAGSVIVAAASAVNGGCAAQIMPSSMTAIAAAMTRCAAAAACGVRRAARELPSAAGACAAQLQTSSTSTAGAGPPTVTG